MGFCAGNSLILGGPRVHLSYSTSSLSGTTFVNQVRSATATPTPDYTGNTGYSNTAMRGISATSSSPSFIKPLVSGVYPNYSIIPAVSYDRMGTFSATITPALKDFSGVPGTTSGPFSATITKNYQWPLLNSFTRNTTNGTDTIGVSFSNFIDGGLSEAVHAVNLSNIVPGTSGAPTAIIDGPDPWATTVHGGGEGSDWNEVMVDNTPGSTGTLFAWGPTSTLNWTTVRSRGTFYDVRNFSFYINPRSSVGTTTANIRVTLRNKLNPAFSSFFDISLTVNRVS